MGAGENGDSDGLAKGTSGTAEIVEDNAGKLGTCDGLGPKLGLKAGPDRADCAIARAGPSRIDGAGAGTGRDG